MKQDYSGGETIDFRKGKIKWGLQYFRYVDHTEELNVQNWIGLGCYYTIIVCIFHICYKKILHMDQNK